MAASALFSMSGANSLARLSSGVFLRATEYGGS